MSEQSLSYSDFHIDSDFENPLICFGLRNHLCDPLLRSISSVQNLSSQNQDLRFIDLVGFPQGYSLDFITASLSKYKWTFTSVYWTWNYIGSPVQPTIPVRCLPVFSLPFLIRCQTFPPTVRCLLAENLPFSPKILNRHSWLHIYHSSSLYYK